MVKRSKIALITGLVFFVAGFALFTYSLFVKVDDPKIFGGLGIAFICVFLVLMFVTLIFREKEMQNETQ